MKQTRDSIKDIRGKRTPHYGERPVRRSTNTRRTGTMGAVGLPPCSNGCGMDIGVKDGGVLSEDEEWMP